MYQIKFPDPTLMFIRNVGGHVLPEIFEIIGGRFPLDQNLTPYQIFSPRTLDCIFFISYNSGH